MQVWLPTVATSNAQRVFHFGLQGGVSEKQLRACGAVPADGAPDGVRSRVAARNMFALWSQLATALDPATPIRLARCSSLEDLQLLGFAVLTAPNVGQGLETFVRYSALLSDAFSWHMHVTGQNVEIQWFCHVPLELGARTALETSLAQFASCMRQLAGADVDPLRASFVHAAPASTRAHRDHFRCRLDWSSDAYRLVYARQLLQAEPPLKNRGLWTYLCKQAEDVTAELYPRSLSARLRSEIASCLAERATPRSAELARRLGLSERALRRYLAQEKLGFRSLVDGARRDRTRVLLTESELPLARVAYEVGFADASALTHACQRWFDAAPGDVRRASR